MKTKLIKWIVNIVFALALVISIMSARGFFEATTTADKVKFAGDGFSITAFILLAIGGLAWVATTGFFDIFSYGIKKGAHMLVPGLVNDPCGRYLDYKTERMEKRAGRKTNYTMLVVGLVCLAVGILLAVIWYRV